ncbi:MAG: rhodanese-like domain-containing protein, partial [Thermoanaerobaculia bacterium]
KRFGELPQDKLIVAYCTCKAEELSLEAAMALARKHGFERVAVLHGGYPAWKDAGYPTEGAPSEDEAPATPAPAASGRVAPPDAVKCDRNQLTMYSGRVKTFERKADTVTIAIDTTAGTTETVTASAFLMNGQPFTAEDWKQVGEGKDVVAWVCTGGPAVLDWRRAVSAAE